MPAGTIYMYYARGGDSLNISCQGEGNAVLIKSAIPYREAKNLEAMIATMQQLNPLKIKLLVASLKNCVQVKLCYANHLIYALKNGTKNSFQSSIFISDNRYRPSKL